ncbi:dioxygenase [Mangrovimicrobium sediminis]|uniref:Dioxygenase n=1 Tax=Mangrovimicrobium sediminis TaxID=2562682 RepID=A0A4Z0M1I1_9GAMM|nr:class III extradiol ring-cleavage dioxygenase [Haliea sp. SAOS-164]TGD73296.1 dioxygenase [Haliea sp. SAOS-164]
MNSNTQVLFLSHGGGPLPLLGDPGHAALVERLREIAPGLRRPSAILVISAHWEAPVATVTGAANPELIYDYYGFPPESYEIRYPCPGQPALADAVASAVAQAGIAVEVDTQRGLDHGVFVPLKIMYPAASIPCVQLSLTGDLDAAAHLALGQALRALEFENLLVIGSGFSFHNMRAFAARTPAALEHNRAFEAWLQETIASPALTEAEREARLRDWAQAPGARFCHPREEHLLPLHVCYGLAGRACDEAHSVPVLGYASSQFLWSR